MTNTPLRSHPLGKGLIVGALLILAVPGTAFAAALAVTVETPGATSGPGAPFAEISTDADCDGDLVSGGGIDQEIGTGMSSNGNKVNGIAPSDDGSTEYTGSTGVVGADDDHWLGIGGSGGQVNGSFSSTPYAMCFTSDVITSTQIVMNKVSGPATGGAMAIAVATCPEDTRLLGGGARTTPASVGSLKPIASFPSYSADPEKAADDTDTNPDSWTAVGLNGGGGDSGNTTYAYAVCSADEIDVSGVTVTVRFSEVSGPTTATTGQTETVGCAGEDGTLISGGAAISGGSVTSVDFTAPGSPGDHLNGSYPSDSGGNPVSDGTTTAANWTAYTHTGGSSSPNTYSDVWALCATGM